MRGGGFGVVFLAGPPDGTALVGGKTLTEWVPLKPIARIAALLAPGLGVGSVGGDRLSGTDRPGGRAGEGGPGGAPVRWIGSAGGPGATVRPTVRERSAEALAGCRTCFVSWMNKVAPARFP